jgi:hypothetical protein
MSGVACQNLIVQTRICHRRIRKLCENPHPFTTRTPTTDRPCVQALSTALCSAVRHILNTPVYDGSCPPLEIGPKPIRSHRQAQNQDIISLNVTSGEALVHTLVSHAWQGPWRHLKSRMAAHGRLIYSRHMLPCTMANPIASFSVFRSCGFDIMQCDCTCSWTHAQQDMVSTAE